MDAATFWGATISTLAILVGLGVAIIPAAVAVLYLSEHDHRGTGFVLWTSFAIAGYVLAAAVGIAWWVMQWGLT